MGISCRKPFGVSLGQVESRFLVNNVEAPDMEGVINSQFGQPRKQYAPEQIVFTQRIAECTGKKTNIYGTE